MMSTTKISLILWIFIIIYCTNIYLNKEEKYIIRNTNNKDKNLLYYLEEDLDCLPIKIYEKYINFQNTYEDYNHLYFHINDMADYIRSNFGNKYLELFILLKDNKDKINLFNLCFKYKQGGIKYNDFTHNKLYTNKRDTDVNEQIKKLFSKQKNNTINKRWLDYTLITNKQYNTLNIKNNSKRKKITLLIRSYKRSDYFKKCIESLKQFDLNIFYEKIILDDFSQDPKLIPIYDELKELGFKIKINDINMKQKSFIRCLSLVSKESDYVFYIDNDIIVKKDVIQKSLSIYNDIKKQCNLDEDKILLSLFNCNDKSYGRHKIVKKYSNFNEKNTIGGANLFFSTCLLDKFRKWWAYNEDFGICEKLREENGKIFTSNKSYCQHIGQNGYNSFKFYFINNYDVAKNF